MPRLGAAPFHHRGPPPSASCRHGLATMLNLGGGWDPPHSDLTTICSVRGSSANHLDKNLPSKPLADRRQTSRSGRGSKPEMLAAMILRSALFTESNISRAWLKVRLRAKSRHCRPVLSASEKHQTPKPPASGRALGWTERFNFCRPRTSARSLIWITLTW